MKTDEMRVPGSLASFIGNRQAVDVLRRAIDQDRLPHALIFSGPPGIGKCTLAILMAQALNCKSPGPQGACGVCSSCRKILAVLRSRYLECLSPRGTAPCGGCANCRILSDQHPDVRLVGILPDKTTISIDQVRELISEISYQPFEARLRVVILDPAEQMDSKAHNSLLKTLEEPASSTIIILVTAKPHLLIQTIRSRARLLQLGPIPEEQIARYLMEHRGRTAEEARLAAAFSHGSLGSALSFDTGAYSELRTSAFRFVSLLLTGGRFTDANAIASGLPKEKKDRSSFSLWLESVEALLQDIYFLHIAPERAARRGHEPELLELAARTPHPRAVAAIEEFKVLRDTLQKNANRQVAVEAFFLSMNTRPAVPQRPSRSRS